MRFLYLLLFFSFITTFTCAQVSDSAISTLAQNEEWMDELQELQVKEQVIRITKRLLLDTSVYARNSLPAEVRYSKNNGARPLYVIDGVPLYLCNIQDVKDVIKLTALISEAEIKHVWILRKEQATALYGTRASAGVIAFEIDETKKTNLEELNLGNDCDPPYSCGLTRAYIDANTPITTHEQNQKWLEELTRLSNNEQVKKINERFKNYASKFAKADTPKKEYWNVQPLFVVDGVPVDIDNSKELRKLTNKLSKEKVDITIMDEKTQSKTLLCGVPSGLILIQTFHKGKKKKEKKRIESR
jgi:hypothetical protein